MRLNEQKYLTIYLSTEMKNYHFNSKFLKLSTIHGMPLYEMRVIDNYLVFLYCICPLNNLNLLKITNDF